MKYIIVKTTDVKMYLEEFTLKNSIFPFKRWTADFASAIKFDDAKQARFIRDMVTVNTPDPINVTEVDDDRYIIPFKIGDITSIYENKTQLLFKSAKDYYPARIICSDRKGIKNGAGKPAPIVVLIAHPTQGEILMEATANGEAYSPQLGSHQALYIKYKH